MDWRLKCLAFYTIDLAPGGKALYTAWQRRAGTYLLEVNERRMKTYSFHIDNFRSFTPGGTALEFGCGSNLLTPLLLRAAGASKVYACDLDRIATVERVNHVIGQLNTRFGTKSPLVFDLEQDLMAKYGIDYRAPFDLRSSGFAPRTIDFICSTSVLEHIPIPDLPAVLEECTRITSGVMSHVVGYADHYAHSDASISHFNFYRYSDRQWRFFNPSRQHQNRLRHSEFEVLFREAGQVAVRSERVPSTDMRRVPLSPRFAGYSADDLYAHDGLFLLRASRSPSV